MDYFLPLALAFITGSFIGSFLNVVIDRLSTGRSIVFGRSYCEHCKKKLAPQDLIPIASYLLLKGKCRYCKSKIPFRLLVMEGLAGLTVSGFLYMFLAGYISLMPAILLSAIFLSCISIFFADIEYGIIPDGLVISICAFSLLYIFSESMALANHLLSAAATLLFFLGLFLITRGKGMGFGDVKLSFALGLFLGFPNILVCLYLAFLTGASFSIILVLWRKIRFFGGTIPFGPFLVISAIIAFFWGEVIMDQFFLMLR